MADVMDDAAWRKSMSDLDGNDALVIEAGKRLGVAWSSFLGDWFVGWSPRNDSYCAEGPWSHWVDLALAIINDPLTEVVRPDVYGGAPPPSDDVHHAGLSDADLRRLVGPRITP